MIRPVYRIQRLNLPWILSTTLLLTGCRWWTQETVHTHALEMIDTGQRQSLGFPADATPQQPQVEPDGEQMYAFNPQPLTPELPDEFKAPAGREDQPREAQSEETDDPTQAEVPDATVPVDDAQPLLSESIFEEHEPEQVTRFGLDDALAYAMRHAREYQNAKEDLYLAALDLSLERHLWTPQFSATVTSDFTNFPRGTGEDPLDRATTTVSEMAVRQQLPLGGEIAARAIHTMVRDVRDLVTKGESGSMILEASIPLLRGAGPTAYESRYAAERTFVYAVRNFERFRRAFLVDIAQDFFNLQQSKAAIANTYRSYINRFKDWQRAEFIHEKGQSRSISEAPRAKSAYRAAEAGLVNAKERFEFALDRFKIRIGMDVETLLTVVDQDVDEASKAVERLRTEVDEGVAGDIALAYRLDLLNVADAVDDRQRGVVNARNRLLPDLDLSGSVAFDSNPDQMRSTNLRDDLDTWSAGLTFSIDDRRSERTDYQASIVDLRRAERALEEFRDVVRSEARRSLRRILQQEMLRRIQEANIEENQHRLDGARAQFELGRATNQDVVDAENDVLAAANDLAAAIAEYRIAILEFRLDTGTLRVSDEGKWLLESPPTDAAADPGP